MPAATPGAGTWNANAARQAALADREDQDATSCLHNAVESFAIQGWQLREHTLWWEPRWSPTSVLRLVVSAKWVGEGAPLAPTVTATVHDIHGRLARVEDVSPFDDYELEQENFVVPRTLRYETNIHLVGSGPDTAPSSVELIAGEADDETLNIPVLNPGLEEDWAQDPNDKRWAVYLSFGFDDVSNPNEAVDRFVDELARDDLGSFTFRVEDRRSGRIFYVAQGISYGWEDFYSRLTQVKGAAGEVTRVDADDDLSFEDAGPLAEDEDEASADPADDEWLDGLAKYPPASKREWAKIGKNPDAHVGTCVSIFGKVTQFDMWTGPDSFRASTGTVESEYSFQYPLDAYLSGDAELLDDVVDGDFFEACVRVDGTYTYETTLGGSLTVLHLHVDAIRVLVRDED